MIAILSPAKSLDFDTPSQTKSSSKIIFEEETNKLVKKLKKLSAKKIGDLMSISATLSDLNYQRYQDFSQEYTTENSKQAILAFTGDVYRGLEATSFTEKEFEYAQNHIRILSGLYGLIKPLDLIQPYRLEMGTKFQITPKVKNLYEFWKDKITTELNRTLDGDILINLASNEYFKSVDVKNLKSDVLSIDFKDNKNGQYKTIMTYAKLARGYMTNYMVKNKVTNIDELRGFDYEGYTFNNELSQDLNWVFTRG